MNYFPLVKPSVASSTVRFGAAEGEHLAQTSRQAEEQHLISPPWQHSSSHVTPYSTIHDFQKHYSYFPTHPIRLTLPLVTFFPQDEFTTERTLF